MKKTQKTYQSTVYVQLDTYVMCKDIKRLIPFRGGTLEPLKNGIFVTSDPDLIEAMDNPKNGLGTSYHLYSVQEIGNSPVKEDSGAGTPISQGAGQMYMDVPGIKTVAAARTWLIEFSEKGNIKEGITASLLKNRVQVLAIAEECKIRFTELPKE